MSDQPEHQDIWRIIPPEEKLAMMARAQASGVMGCVVVIVTASTLAIALKASWLLWSSFVLAPFVFQYAAGKMWRDLRPRAMLEYLAARSASRRYAFANKAHDLGVQLMLKGTIKQQFKADEVMESIEAAVENNLEAAVWITLFNDSVVMIKEQMGGAALAFAHNINDRLEVLGKSPVGEDDYSSRREVIVRYKDRKNDEIREFMVTSRYPAALVVFEKRLKSLLEKKKALLSGTPMEAAQLPDPYTVENDQA